MAESGHETEDRAVPAAGGSPAAEENKALGSGDESAAEKPVDEVKIAELLLQFERENEELENVYPYWVRGILWTSASAVSVGLVMYMMYAETGTMFKPLLGTAIISLTVWVGTTFLPVKA